MSRQTVNSFESPTVAGARDAMQAWLNDHPDEQYVTWHCGTTPLGRFVILLITRRERATEPGLVPLVEEGLKCG